MKRLRISIDTIVYIFLAFFGGLGTYAMVMPTENIQQQPVEQFSSLTPAEQTIEELWSHVMNSEILQQELVDAHLELSNLALGNDCITCHAIALMALREYDGNWADTLGEFSEADDLDSCLIEVLFDAECTRLP